jgi:hypothetical protein
MSEDYVLVDFTNDSKLLLRLSMVTEDGEDFFVTDVEPGTTTRQLSPVSTTWMARLMWELGGPLKPAESGDVASVATLIRVDEYQLPPSLTMWGTTATQFAPLSVFKPDPDAEVLTPVNNVASLTLTMDWEIRLEKGRCRYEISETGVTQIMHNTGFVMPPFG